jgi:hypothetical protein
MIGNFDFILGSDVLFTLHGIESEYLILVLYFKLQESSTAVPAAQQLVCYLDKGTCVGESHISLSCYDCPSPVAYICQAELKNSSSKLHTCCTKN